MTRDEIDRLITAMRAHGVTHLEWAQSRKGQALCLTLPETAAEAPLPPAPVAGPQVTARAPGLGQFLPRGGDDGLPPLLPGQPVQQGEVLGYLAQDAWAQVLAAPTAGSVIAPLPVAGQIFGHGDPVITLEGTPA